MPDFYFGDSYPLVLTDTGVVAELPAGTAIAGITVDSVSGLSTSLSGKESVLGNPASDGQVLSSTAAGVRSWITVANPLGTILVIDGMTVSEFADWMAITANAVLFDAICGSFSVSGQMASNAGLMSAVAASSTAMAAVAASSTAMAAVAASSTAMAAVAASSTAMTAVIASSTALTAVIASSTAMDSVISSLTALTAIFANSTALTTFKSSTALTVKTIPTMTSNTAPSGVASASSIYNTTDDAWKAFNNASGYWIASNLVTTNSWVKYDFTVPVYIHTSELKNDTFNGVCKDFRVECSQDNTNWTTALTGTQANNTTLQIRDVINAGKYRYWRLYCINSYSASYVGIDDMQLSGFA